MIRHFTKSWPCYRPGPYFRLWHYYQIRGGFHRTFATVQLANRGSFLLRTPCPVPFGTCICSNVATILSWPWYVFRLGISNIPQYFYFASVLFHTFSSPSAKLQTANFEYQEYIVSTTKLFSEEHISYNVTIDKV